MNKNYISSVEIGGTAYAIKDAELREIVQALFDEWILDCGGAPSETPSEEECVIDCGGAPIEDV